MTAANDLPPIRQDHIRETLQSVAQLRAEQEESASAFQRAVDRIAGSLGRPWFIGALAILVGGWMGLNVAAAAFGYRALDPPPFLGLQGAASLSSLGLVVLILGAQAREDQLTRHRELLNLEVAILSEQKIAKAIQLLEELRRDSPQIRDRIDEEAAAMAEPARPQSVLDGIKQTPKHIRDRATGS